MRHLAAIVEMRRRRGGLQREYAGEDLVSRSRQAPTKPGIPPPASGSSQIVATEVEVYPRLLPNALYSCASTVGERAQSASKHAPHRG